MWNKKVIPVPILRRNFANVPYNPYGNTIPMPYSKPAGPVCRSGNSGITATVFGSYGFLGRYLANDLGLIGTRMYAPFRGCELEVRLLKPLFDLGQLGLIPFSPRDEDIVYQSLQNSNVVVNLIGKHYETKHIVPTRRANGQLSRINYDFEEVNVAIPRRLAKLAKKAGVETFIHVSALSADINSSSKWSQTKALGEIAVREEFPEAIIVRPATIFGHEDRFLNRIAETIHALPRNIFPLINNGNTLVQPVFAGDVAKAIVQIIYNWRDYEGRTFQLGGPAEYTMKEVVEFVSDVTTLDVNMVNIPLPIAKGAALIAEQLINPIITPDQLNQLLENNVVTPNSQFASAVEGSTLPGLTFKDLNIEPASMDRLAFDYLHRFRPGGHFTFVEGYHTKI